MLKLGPCQSVRRSSRVISGTLYSAISHTSSKVWTVSRSFIVGGRTRNSVEKLLIITLQSASSLCIAFSNSEDVDTERNAHDTGNNQRPGITPDLCRPDHLIVQQSCA